MVGQTIAEVIRELVIDTVRFCGGNMLRASQMLGCTHKAVRNKLKRYQEEGFDIPPRLPKGGSKIRPRRIE